MYVPNQAVSAAMEIQEVSFWIWWLPFRFRNSGKHFSGHFPYCAKKTQWTQNLSQLPRWEKGDCILRDSLPIFQFYTTTRLRLPFSSSTLPHVWGYHFPVLHYHTSEATIFQFYTITRLRLPFSSSTLSHVWGYHFSVLHYHTSEATIFQFYTTTRLRLPFSSSTLPHIWGYHFQQGYIRSFSSQEAYKTVNARQQTIMR